MKKIKLLGEVAPPFQVGDTTSSVFTYMTNAYNVQFYTDLIGPGDGTAGAMPNLVDNKNGLVHKDTPAISLVNRYPFLYKEIDTTSGAQYWSYRGTGHNTYAYLDTKVDTGYTLALANDDDDNIFSGDNVEIVNSLILKNLQCSPPTLNCTGYSGTNPDYQNYQYWIRLQLDACTNQYLIPMGLNPGLVFSDDYRYDNYAWNESFCQPLALTPLPCLPNLVQDHSGKSCLVDNGSSTANNGNIYQSGPPTAATTKAGHVMYDYRAWGYLEQAWHDVLNSNYAPASGTDANTLTIGASTNVIKPLTINGQESYGQPFTSTTKGTVPGPGFATGATNAVNTFSGNLTTINDISQRPYERIFDSTHPYSPRWDMTGFTDRSYSKDTLITNGGYNLIDSSCYVRCASVPVDILTFRAPEFNACITCRINIASECFWSEFIINLIPRIITIGFIVIPLGGGDMYSDPVDAFLDTIEGQSNVLEWFPGNKCKTRLQSQTNNVYSNANNSGTNLAAGGLGAQLGNWPPCSTQFDSPIDNVPGNVNIWVNQRCTDCDKMANDYANNTDHKSSVTKCCNDLAQAVAPLNTLKIRNTQDDPTIKDNGVTIPSGATAPKSSAEGYAFQAYFPPDPPGTVDGIGNDSSGQVHMPYMRWWDTGVAAGGGAWPGMTPLFQYAQTNYDPFCDKGKDDVVVGVGIESQDSPATGSPPGLCRFGGNNGVGYECLNIGATTTDTLGNKHTTDRLTSWFELKQYQTNSVRYYGLNCLPIYDQLYKWLGQEDGALHQAGKHFDTVVMEQGYIDKFGNNLETNNSAGEYKNNPWPLRWRGYLDDQTDTANFNKDTDKNRFPNFDPGTTPAAALMTGLDNAQVGDIVYYSADDPPAKDWFAPFVGVVTSVRHNVSHTTSNITTCLDAAGNATPLCTDPDATCSDYVEIVDQNFGKFPDACGNTDYMGQGQTRRIFKEWLPVNIADIMFAGTGTTVITDTCGDSHAIPGGGAPLTINSYGSCEDPKLSVCTFSLYYYYTGNAICNNPPCSAGPDPDYWGDIKVYRPKLDERGNSR